MRLSWHPVIGAIAACVALAAAPTFAESATDDRAGKQAAKRERANKAKAKRERANKAKAKREQANKAKAKRKRARKNKARKLARRKRKRRSNMPAGWTWPPSSRMKRDGDACKQRLDDLGVVWNPVEHTDKVATPIVVPDLVFGHISLASTFRKPPFVMDCHLAEALATHSKVLHDLGVRQLRFSSIHSYRNATANGVTSESLSRHALGLAVDVFEVVMDDDVLLVVERDYGADDGVLRAIEDAVNQTGGFRAVLSPGNDPISHDDHFHVSARIPRPHSQ